MDTDGSSALAIVPSEARLFGKMAQVMGIINRVPKSGNNTFHKYRYATADDVADTIREAMAEVNLALIVRMGDVKQETFEYMSDGKPKSTIRTTITFDFIFACGDTGAVISSPWTAQVDDNSDKAINKCATSAEKYFLMKTFIVSAGDEPDSDADKHTPEPARKVVPMPPANGKSPEPVREWWQDEDTLCRLADRCYANGFIAQGGCEGIPAMEALIAPRTWAAFPTVTVAAVAVKEAFEALQTSLKSAEPTAEEARAKLNTPKGSSTRKLDIPAGKPGEAVIDAPEAQKLVTGGASVLSQFMSQDDVNAALADLDDERQPLFDGMPPRRD